MLPVESPFKAYTGLDGNPLNNGYVYFGEPNLNPITSPVPVFWDAEGTIPAAQPLRTINGYIVRAGTPANVFTNQNYSEVVVDSKSRQVFYARDSSSFSLSSAIKNLVDTFSGLSGANLLGFIQDGIGSVLMTVQEALRERVTARQFGAKFNNTTDDGPAFNKAMLKLSNDGGGILRAGRGIAKIITPILLCSNVVLDLTGCTLNGNGSNTLIKSGAVIGGNLLDITTEYGSGGQGEGSNLVFCSRILGGKLANAACGVRGHRLNYGTTIEHVNFDSTLALGWETSHSWGLKIHQNLVYPPVIMKDFVDWTEVSGNSFEGNTSVNQKAAITVTTGGFGGSYSARFISNGFHHWTKGIEFTCEAANAVIESNHSEDTKYFVSGGAQTCKNFSIKNNWVKANLIPAAGGCIGISFLSLWDSECGPNTYTDDGASSFDAYVNLQPSNCFGNTVPVPYSPPGTIDISKYQLNDANNFVMRGGSNNNDVAQPTIESFTGSGYSVVQYKNRYHNVANTIPYCATTYNAGTITIDTWIPCTQYGVKKRVMFDFFINGANTYMIDGSIGMLIVKTDRNHDFFLGSPSTLVVTATNSGGAADGNLRITITGAPSVGNITGWVKEA